MAERTDVGPILHRRILQDRGHHAATVSDAAIVDDRIGPNVTILADRRLSPQMRVGPDDGVFPDGDVALDVGCRRIEDRDAG